MVESQKPPKIVGHFIRQRREALGLSQRALGLLFTPPVTTQFISNVERGVTPLPPAHVPILTKALLVSEQELMNLLEKEYTQKLSGRLGKPDGSAPTAPGGPETTRGIPSLQQLILADGDYNFMRVLYDAYRHADPKTRQAFATVCESMLNLPKQQAVSSSNKPDPLND